MTFCTPAPAAQDDLQSRCVKTTVAFIAIADDETTWNAAWALFDKLDTGDQQWLVEIALPAYELAGMPALHKSVPHVFKACMDRGAV